MMKRYLLSIAALCLIGTMAMAQDAPVTLFSIKDGETLLLRNVTTVSSNCEPLFEAFEDIDVIEGSPELTLKFEPGLVTTNTTRGPCLKPVAGGQVFITAKEVTERKEVPLTFRVRYNTKNGPWQQTVKFRILMFPGTKS
jgi:hypothetical protein